MTGAQGFIVWDDIWLILINFKQLKQSSIYSNHGGAQAGPAGVAFTGGAKTGPKSNMQSYYHFTTTGYERKYIEKMQSATEDTAQYTDAFK